MVFSHVHLYAGRHSTVATILVPNFAIRVLVEIVNSCLRESRRAGVGKQNYPRKESLVWTQSLLAHRHVLSFSHVSFTIVKKRAMLGNAPRVRSLSTKAVAVGRLLGV